MVIPADGLRVNVGAGSRCLDGWFNVDIEQNPEAPRPLDLVCDGKLIPLPDGCAREVMAIHVFEHFFRWECEAVLKEWHRLLRPGGLLILELPDLIKCCQNVIDGVMRGGKHPDQLGRWGLYGDPRLENKFMCHPWGWAPKELAEFLKANGFRSVEHKTTVFHPAGRKNRDMRIEAVK